MKPHGLSGYVMTRNCRRLDYCYELAIESLLPVCDEVLVCDSDSDDGTREELDLWAMNELKLRVINRPWPNPVGDTHFLVKWINEAREHLKYSMQLNLEADEVIPTSAYPAIRQAVENRECRTFRRLNFWRSTEFLAPENTYCGTTVARLGPQNLWMSSDAPDPHGSQELAATAINAGQDQRLEIFHYGALRKNDAFLKKSRVMQSAIMNSYDSRLAEAEKTGVPWESLCDFGGLPLIPFRGAHPSFSIQWLRDRGFNPKT